MAKGIVRNIDDLGRIVIPKEMRKSLKLKEGEPVDIYFKNGVIHIEPCKLQCVCCGAAEEDKLVELNGVLVCGDCARELYGKVPYNI